MDRNPTYAEFAQFTGSVFAVHLAPEEVVELMLSSATEVGPNAADGGQPRWERFSLLFHGPRSRFIAQATYAFEHPTMGRFPLFIVPLGVDGESYQYEAIFNQRARPEATTP
jgi:hypothetical protein